MAYALNSIDLSTYGIIEGRIRGGNVALQGQYDFPSRIGDVLHEWGDENYPEIYTDTDEMFWGGRDLTFEAHIPGTRSAIYDALASFYAATTAPSGLQSFATPYGTFNVYPKAIAVTHGFGATSLKVTFREPVVDLSGGSIPAPASGMFKIDGIPLTAFGLYYSGDKSLFSLPEMQGQEFTKIEAEGFQVAYRKSAKFELNGSLISDSVSGFESNVRGLYAILAASGLRTFNLNEQIEFTGAVLNGFKIENLNVGSYVSANFKCDVTLTSITP
ncbi:MAG: hypothetical protein BWY95_01319 [Bacteroidetes bacterium ADurb.BinA104]|jgi:hypothetical protein|nr:MAG: hypothetical protein BWY95_01319 [Bacteroidetes bacterium ADurb.BinA104]